ncbi:GSCOCG00003334001-RA-CDS [Cotesia congregata]|uniref:Similar to ovca2: Esterase OVCA2 (Danio rerio) n=1 Tax=Cotesia congregata TaxID=51543 RepID=A0A8J2MYT2_COTCN|nr:GSCOCG00003334001-RA-CDS [Cotesia congregata]CAG5108430.1 Similar to ovca2: Esterase OVCA2 (Danio rerio) [Cotesia congregata]
MSGSNDKLRILALHGFRQSDIVFRSKIGSLRKNFKQKIEFYFARAPHVVPPLENNKKDDNEEKTGEEAADTGEESRGWWFNTEDLAFKAIVPSNMSVGFEDSLKVIEKIFQEQGPFDGVLGFSQGASFVSILCAMQQKNLGHPSIKFKFAIMVCGFKSLCEPHAKFYDEKINLPAFFVYGTTDRLIPIETAEALVNMFTNKKVFVHDGGHYIAGKKHIYNDFFSEMYAIKNSN